MEAGRPTSLRRRNAPLQCLSFNYHRLELKKKCKFHYEYKRIGGVFDEIKPFCTGGSKPSEIARRGGCPRELHITARGVCPQTSTNPVRESACPPGVNPLRPSLDSTGLGISSLLVRRCLSVFLTPKIEGDKSSKNAPLLARTVCAFNSVFALC
jgi:hypothetical protein